jgi:hypothetical protein
MLEKPGEHHHVAAKMHRYEYVSPTRVFLIESLMVDLREVTKEPQTIKVSACVE